jgi:CheY-like chemotaxis protein
MMKNRREPANRLEALTSLPAKTILLVCDLDDSRIALKWFLSISGYVVDAVRSAQEAISVFNPVIHDMVVTDNTMPGMTGVEMAHIIKLRSSSTPVVMYTGIPPSDRSCVDLIVEKSVHMLALKVGMDGMFAPCRA